MNTYDFHKIFSPTEFENFARDVMQVREGILFESFAEGADQGIDNRRILEDGTCIILQAKRWGNSEPIRFAQLRQEREKLDRLERKPDRYILVTSRDMTPLQKERVVKLFAPYILGPEDVVTGEDLNNYIQSPDGRFRGVEEKYFKLWLQNTDVLKRVLQETVHSALVEESRMELRRIIRDSAVFVETGVYRRALQQLRKNKVIIISGEPGMGKTTLAGQLGLYYCLKKDYSSFLWVSQVDDLYTSCQMGEKRVIIFDDFWGSSYFEKKKAGREEERLARFMENLRRNDGCVLILTTRAYILEQGLKQHENLRTLIEAHKLECRLQGYTERDKAEIYMSHLSRSELRPDQLIYLFELHSRIVYSPDYNPRVIGMFLQNVDPEEDGETCAEHFLEYLRNPVDFWKKVFSDLSREARALYVIMYLNGRGMQDDELKACYLRVLPLLGGAMECKTFGEALAELEKTVTWTEPDLDWGGVDIKFQNPSAREFMAGYLRDNLEQYYELIKAGCVFFRQCTGALKLLRSKGIFGAWYGEMLERAVRAVRRKSGSEYVIEFFKLLEYYQPGGGAEIERYFRETMEAICDGIRRHTLTTPGTVIWGFPEAAVCALNNGLLVHPGEIVSLYMEGSMKLGMLPLAGAFRRHYPSEFDDYIRVKRERIRLFLISYFRTELCLYAANGDADEFEDEKFDYQESLETYGLSEIAEIEDIIQKHRVWLSGAGDDEEDDEEYEADDRQEYEQTIARYEEELLGTRGRGEYVDEETFQEYLAFYQAPEPVCSQLRELRQGEGPWYWDEFVKYERSLPFFIPMAAELGTLCETFEGACRQVFLYLCRHTGVEPGQLEQIFLLFRREQEVLKSELRTALDDLDCPDGTAGRLEELGAIVRVGGCYELAEDLLGVMAQIRQIGRLRRPEREAVYRRAILDEDGEFDRDERYFIKALSEADGKLSEHYLFLLAGRYLRRYEGLGEEARLEAFLRDMDLTFQVDESLKNSGASYNCEQLTDVLGYLDRFYVTDLLPDQIERPVFERLQALGVVKKSKYSERTEYDIQVKDIEDRKLLDALGITEHFKEAWQYFRSLAEGMRTDE